MENRIVETRFIVKTKTFSMALSPDFILEKIGIELKDGDEITDVAMSVEREGCGITAYANRDADYTGMFIEGKDKNENALQLGNFELPSESFPNSMTARLYAGYESFEAEGPIAMTRHRLLEQDDLDKKAPDREGYIAPKKIVHVDTNVASCWDWKGNSENSLWEHNDPADEEGS